MYKCQGCKKSTSPGQKELKIQAYRPKQYVNYKKVDKKSIEIITSGTEIEKEVRLCSECVIKLKEKLGL